MKRRRSVTRRGPRGKKNIGLYQTTKPASRIWPCSTLAETKGVATRMAGSALPNVWLLHGPLGSGKTTFVRYVLRALGWSGTVSSPTFVLRHDFPLHNRRWRRVVHVDAYRVRDQREEAALDLITAWHDPSCLVLIEWPEKLRRLPRRRSLVVDFSYQPVGRKLRLSRPV